MTYAVKWARQPRTLVGDAAELDAVLDQITAAAASSGHPHVVSIYPTEHDSDWPPTLQIGLGHPHRATAHWINTTGAGTGYDPSIPPWPQAINFDLGGVATQLEPDDTRLTPTTARDAAHEYIRTGTRPTCLMWQDI